MSSRKIVGLLLIIYFFALCVYAVWTFSLTDPNLVLSSWPLYWSFQQFMWKNLFGNAQLLSQLYVVLLLALFGVYGLLIALLYRARRESWLTRWGWQKVCIIVVLCSLPLLISYNALSHDIFNYLFNAKMVVVYGSNPHTQVALDFPADQWTRFMHNTHTPAPYWYGWTGLTLLPYLMGLGKFTLTWLIFKVWGLLSLLALVGTWYLWTKWRGKPLSTWLVLAVALNPLVLIEVVSNAHNDLWMMVPALLSIGLILYQKLGWKVIIGSFLLLLASASIKYATLVLLPLWIVILIVRWWNKRESKLDMTAWINLKLYSPLIASVLLFLTLLTERSKQFLPWYLSWSLVWIPLFAWNNRQLSVNHASTRSNRLSTILLTLTKIWTTWLLGLSISALFRYVPWLLSGEYSVQLLTQQKWIVWGGGLILIFWITIFSLIFNQVKTEEKKK